ncbi:hypothetical protein I302_107815 [Kwoniella bestiolae CBS 10118]|uniref:Amidohydrolase n=1 Tax=Kwoniella bestiolae CBS 10118 TaxID=1296100 RepID=A0A1B9FXG2_9TREE|nr:amidohydrolase [Kwoniella bestiolae CBS 10118]OCF23463.1 amidohydrolase [Kwoniella bestiolae CBS 10118]
MSSHHSHKPRARYRDIEKPSSSSSSEESDIPLPSSYKPKHKKRSLPSKLPSLLALVGLLYLLSKINLHLEFPYPRPAPAPLPKYIEEGLKQCEIINRPTPHFKPSSHKREKNDRYVEGTKSVWLKNGTLWTGEKGGTEILRGVDVLLEGGVIRRVGSGKDIAGWPREKKGGKVEEIELGGAWVTPGFICLRMLYSIVDTHSHMGVDGAPELFGNEDTNSIKGSVQPWLRSLDGFNTHDLAFNLSIAGGITTMLVLPGSADSIGGQAFPFKPRWTHENTPQSMLVEPAWKIDNGTWARTHSWRHIKHACGENPKRVYGQTRMDNAYDFRRAYTEGKTLKDKQDRWCSSPKTQTEPFPESLEWEVLSDVIRGNVKVNIHCYETTDLNALVRISNEFQFPIAAFHHAHETYLVPDLLKQAWGPEPPAVAIFSTNARYKREAYRGSEFAAKILADEGLKVIMKSDHPVLDSRYLLTEASWVHHYGLNVSESLNSITTTPARAVGLDHRIGYLREGYDADLVVWDSFPLVLGATPKQTYIDGIPQIINPVVHEKPKEAQEVPKEEKGKWDKEIREALDTRGEPDLRARKSVRNVIYQGVGEFHLTPLEAGLGELDLSVFDSGKGDAVVVVRDGKITCAGDCSVEEELKGGLDFEVVDLKGGAITPGYITVGSYVGILEIRQEKVTGDGSAIDPLSEESEITTGIIAHAVDGAQFGGKDELLAYRSGVTTAVVSPKTSSWISGFAYAFSPESEHSLEHHSIQNPLTALHISLDNSKSSVSSKIAILRKLLSGHSHHASSSSEDEEGTELVRAFESIRKGELRLVIRTDKADVIASLIRLKRDVADKAKITILGGQESWIVADELAENDIGVIVSPVRSYPGEWDTRRIIPSIPLSNHTLPSYLVSHSVTVGLGIQEEWQARNTLYEAAWVYASSPKGVFTKRQALDLVGKNLEELLGLNKTSGKEASWVAHEGDPFEFGGRVRSVKGLGGEGKIDLF